MRKLFSLRRKDQSIITPYKRALQWIRENTIPEKGVTVSSKNKTPYPEVTGYLIPTLLRAGEKNLAARYARFLSFIQKPNGAFCGPDGKEYFFDTGQVLRGLLEAAEIFEEFKTSSHRAADYLCERIGPEGRIQSEYDEKIPAAVNVYALFPLLRAAEVFQEEKFANQAKAALGYFKAQQDTLDPAYLTHFLAYIIDGFLECGEEETVRPLIDRISSKFLRKGTLPAYPDANWTCSVGLAQFAVIGYKAGNYEFADKAVSRLCAWQNPSGGFFGSYGGRGDYFPDEEISWAAKFFLDALHYKVETFFKRNADIFPSTVAEDDERLNAVKEAIKDVKGGKVLDAGSGKGRFAEEIKNMSGKFEVHAVDISREMLTHVPDGIQARYGTILNLPFEDGSFDAVICVEALEHVIDVERAVGELTRVLKDEGTIVIVDKNIEKAGKMEITDFEQWFDKGEVKKYLGRVCRKTDVKTISCSVNKTDDLFIVWTGKKGRATLGEDEWHEAIVAKQSPEELASRIRQSRFPLWTQSVLEATAAGEKVLELGSGTGELSAVCALYGRQTVCLDFSEESLAFAKRVYGQLNIDGEFIRGDMLEGIPLEDSSIDWVMSSGVLEHFSDSQIIGVLRESRRVARKGVISLVPNARSLPYRLGKHRMEQEGTWPYGREDPKFTLKPLFEEAGLTGMIESTVAPYHALEFLGSEKSSVKEFYDGLTTDELNQLNQGYLLVTVGYVES